MEEIFRLRDYEPFWNEWHVDRQVCEGNLSNVYEVRNAQKTAMIKVISVPKLQVEGRTVSPSPMENQEAMSGFFKDVVEALETELERLRVLNNIPNILGYQQYEAFERKQEVGYDFVILMDKEENLLDYLKKNKEFGNREIVKLIGEAAWILEQAHREGIIHKDLKPENIFVKENGECMVGDFAMARKVESYQSRNQRKVEPAYIAPEVLSDYDYTVSTDIYALGVVLYILLNDQIIPAELVNRKFRTNIPNPVRAGEKLSALVQKAIAYRKDERFATAEEFYCALNQLTEQDLAYPPSYVSEEEKKRNWEQEEDIRKERLEREARKRREEARKREEEQKKIQEQKEFERKQKEIEEAKAREEQLARELEEKRVAKEREEEAKRREEALARAREEEAKRREEALARAREEEAKRKEEELIRAREEAKRKEEALAKAREEEARRKEEALAKKQQLKEEQEAEKQRKIEEKQRMKREEKEQRENKKKQRKEERQQKRKDKIEKLKNIVRKGKEARAKQQEEEKRRMEQAREQEEERLQKEQQRKEAEERERQERERKEAEEREKQERERKEAEEREKQERVRKEAEERERQERERKEAEERERQERERKEAEERERQEKERKEAEKRKEQEEVRIREEERRSVLEEVSQNGKEENTIDRRCFEPGEIFTNYTSLDEEKNLDEYFEKNFVTVSEKSKNRKVQEQKVEIDQTPFDAQTLMGNLDETDREEPVFEIHSKAEEYCGFFDFEAEEFKEKVKTQKDLYDKNMEEEPYEQNVVKFEETEGNSKIWLIIVLFLVLGGLGFFAWNNDKVRQSILDTYHKVMVSLEADSDDRIEEPIDSGKE